MGSRSNASDALDAVFDFVLPSLKNSVSKSRTTNASGPPVTPGSPQDGEISDIFRLTFPISDDFNLDGSYVPNDLNLLSPSLIQFNVDESDDSIKFRRETPLPPMPVIKSYNTHQTCVSIGTIYKSGDYTDADGHSGLHMNHLQERDVVKKEESTIRGNCDNLGQSNASDAGDFEFRDKTIGQSGSKSVGSGGGESSGVGKIEKTKSKRQSRRYAAPRRSRYCHLCARHDKTVEMIGCGNIKKGTCQKSICVKCIKLHNLQVNCADWTCPHCQNKCPSRAKCFSYDRQTAQRREKLKRAKNEAGAKRR